MAQDRMSARSRLSLRGPVLTALAVCSLAGAAAADDNGRAVARLHERWDRARSEIKSARLTFRLIRTANDGVVPVSRREFVRIIEGTDLVADPDALKPLAESLVEDIEEYKLPWATVDLTVAGDETREVIRETWRPDARIAHIRVRSGGMDYLTLLRHHPSLQIHQGMLPLKMIGLGDLRFVPGRDPASRWTLRRQEDDRLTFHVLTANFSHQFEVDQNTGFVHSHRLSAGDGTLTRETLQQGPKSYADGVVLPTVVIRSSWDRSGSLSRLWISILEDAEINAPVTADTFAVPVAAGTFISDHRKQPGHSSPVRSRRTEDTDDIRREYGMTPRPSAEPP